MKLASALVQGPGLVDNRYNQELAYQQHQHDPYQAYPQEAPPHRAPRSSQGGDEYHGPAMAQPGIGQQVPLRASEGDEYFDPYAPAATNHERRESSAGGDGYPVVLPPVYLVRHLTCVYPLSALTILSCFALNISACLGWTKARKRSEMAICH